MYIIILLLGFGLCSASTFTTFYANRLGERRGRLVSAGLRNAFGFPLLLLGYVLAVRQPMPPLFVTSTASDILAWLLIAAGATVVLLALISLRRPAVAPAVGDALVTRGLYAHVRHPIYSGVMLEMVGLAVLSPTIAMVLASVLSIAWLLLQVRLEEADLRQRIPGYRDYCARIPRFIPH